MKKLNFVLVGMIAFAPALSWAEWDSEIVFEREANTKREVADMLINRDEFSYELKQAAAERLAGIAPDIMISATVTQTKYTWVGETACAPNDPRLTLILTGYGACTKGKLGASPSCWSTSSSLPIFDPCLYDPGKSVKITRTKINK